MTSWRDPDEVDGPQIDDALTDALLAGRVAPEDAPPGLSALAHLTQLSHGPTAPSELVGHDAAVAAMVSAAVPTIDLRTGRRSGAALRRVASAPVIVVMIVGLGAAMAAAATGAFHESPPNVVVLEDPTTTVDQPVSTVQNDRSTGVSTTSVPVVTPTSAVPSTSEPTSDQAPATRIDEIEVPPTPPSPAGGTTTPRTPATTAVPRAPTTSAVPEDHGSPAAGPPAVTQGMCVAFGDRTDPPGGSAAAQALAKAAADAGVTVEELCESVLGGAGQGGARRGEPRGPR